MPELPEVEHVRAGLSGIIGRRVTAVTVRRADVLADLEGRPVRPGPRALLAGDRVGRLDRRGKQLAIIGDSGRCLVVQLGMTGSLRLRDHSAPIVEHVHVAWDLDDGSRLEFRDPRRFGRVRPATPIQLDDAWRRLGPDALRVTAADLARAFAGRRCAVKAALLNQALLAGVGNIYADESLFAAGLRPTRRAGTITPAEAEVLALAIRDVLSRSIAAGGSTVRDYAGASGEPGAAQLLHRVYGRAGLPCARCSGTLRRAIVGQRTTVFCPRCQPGAGRPRRGPTPPRSAGSG